MAGTRQASWRPGCGCLPEPLARMVTALDSSVLLDVITDSAVHAEASEQCLRQARAEGAVIICECVIAEIRPAFHGNDVNEFMNDWQLEFVASSQSSALLCRRAVCSAPRARRTWRPGGSRLSHRRSRAAARRSITCSRPWLSTRLFLETPAVAANIELAEAATHLGR